jgi:hypothetical protein
VHPDKTLVKTLNNSQQPLERWHGKPQERFRRHDSINYGLLLLLISMPGFLYMLVYPKMNFEI